MFKSIKKRTITPIENSSSFLLQVDGFNQQVVDTMLTFPYLGEGIFGCEWACSSDDTEHFLYVPSIFRERLGEESNRDLSVWKNDQSLLHCYTVELGKPTFLPLHTKDELTVMSDLSLLPMGSDHIYIQLLFSKRSDKWQETLINQYESYLRGNDYPSPKTLGRKFQDKLLQVLDRVSGFESKREYLLEVEEKVLDTGFRFEWRMMYYGEKPEVFEQEVEEVIKQMNYFNELDLIKRKNKQEFLNHLVTRRFTEISQHQMLSEAELRTLLSCKPITKHEPALIPIKREVTAPTPRVFENGATVLDLLPQPPVKETRTVDMEIVPRIPQALKTAKVVKDQKINIKDVELGPTVQSITFEIPQGIVYSDVTKKIKDIEAVLAKTNISVTPGKEPNTINFLIPADKRDVIYLIELLKSPEFIQFAESHALPFVCGVDIYNNLVMKCLTEAPHLLLAGTTNSGKSMFLNAILITFILMKKPDELRLILIDPKQVELTAYEGFAHVDTVITDMKEAYETLEGIAEEMETRYSEFAKIGVKKIKDFNKKSKTKMPYIIAAIDEYADLQIQFPDVEEVIKRLGAKARAAGIHLIVATQRPDSTVVSPLLKTNMPSRISFQLNSSNEYRTVFGTGIPYKLLGNGDGVISYVGQTEEFIRFLGPVITLDAQEEEETFESIKKYYAGEEIKNLKISLPQVQEEEPIEKLKRLILSTGETRVTHLQKLVGIRTSVVTELMQQLVDEGVLMREGKGYKIMEQPIEEEEE